MNEAQTGERVISSPQDEFDSLRFAAPESPCPYLPGRYARSEAYYVEQLEGARYEALLARGFRRSGCVVYRPRCRGCQECRAVRIPVADFSPSRSCRRVWRRNTDLRVTVGDPRPSREKFELFSRYLDHQHDQTMSRDREAFEEFLYDSPMAGREFSYFLGDRLIGVGIADIWSTGVSSVYMYFDPAFARRSPGTYSVLWEIEYCRRRGIQHYYLGFFVAGSPKMAYKSRFRPHEVLVGDDRWLTIRE
ncbi:MAG: arginyltransferase [Phycisphaerae bacterium]